MRPEPRLVRPAEVEVIRATLALARAGSVAPAVLSSLADLRVVGGCTCGCASVDFEIGRNWAGAPLANGVGRTGRGILVGIIVWGRTDAVTSLEIYNYEGECSDAELPVPASIEAYSVPVQDFTR